MLTIEILTPDRYDEYERFVKNHPNGSFMQSPRWRHVKSNWDTEIIASRNAGGEIVGGVAVLIQKVPLIGVSLMYAPRGPVCDLYDRAVLKDLMTGVHMAAKKHRAYLFKIDPNVTAGDSEFIEIAKENGFVQNISGDAFEAIQARFNYRLYIAGKTQDELFASFTQKTRYNIRVAAKHGVQIRVVGKEHLDDFMRLMRTTGARDGFGIRPKAYFERMLECLADDARMYMAFYNETAVSAAIAVNYAGKTNYVYGASDNEHRNVMPNYLLQWEMMKWAVETGCSVYDLQGVSGDLDESNPLYGLYRFKKGFNGTLDELAGEFDYVYRPWLSRLIDFAIDMREKLIAIKRKFQKTP